MITIYFGEALLSRNNFGTPKEVTNEEFIYVQLVRLLLLEPGTIQSHPDMGVGIQTRYRYMEIGEAIRSMKTDLSQQIAIYLPELVGVEVDISQQGAKGISIKFNINGVLYDFSYDTEGGKLESLLNM